VVAAVATMLGSFQQNIWMALAVAVSAMISQSMEYQQVRQGQRGQRVDFRRHDLSPVACGEGVSSDSDPSHRLCGADP
jgi:hypothetical protein